MSHQQTNGLRRAEFWSRSFRPLQTEFDQLVPRPGEGGDTLYRVRGDNLGQAAQAIVIRTTVETDVGSLCGDVCQLAAGAADDALEYATVAAEVVAINANGIALRLHRPFHVGAQLGVNVLGLFNRFEQLIGFVVKQKDEFTGPFLCEKTDAVLILPALEKNASEKEAIQWRHQYIGDKLVDLHRPPNVRHVRHNNVTPFNR